jgi:hypothetical protein
MIELTKHRAKSVLLAKHRAATILKNVKFSEGTADVCVIKDQMGYVLGEVRAPAVARARG